MSEKQIDLDAMRALANRSLGCKPERILAKARVYCQCRDAGCEVVSRNNFEKMSTSDLVHRVFAELLAWEQHEACEAFCFDGVRIFNPHAPVTVLSETLSKYE
jgi:hypothetical protein